MKIRPSDTKQWYSDRGDETLRLDYPLTPQSVVFDVGARIGDWAAPIHAKYGCQVVCFEPIQAHCIALKQRMPTNAIRVVSLALAASNSPIVMGIMDGEASKFHEDNPVDVKCITLANYLISYGLPEYKWIDLMKINIEGMEFELIDNIIESGLMHRIKDLQVQFHLIPNAEEQYKELAAKLSRTHFRQWRYPFVWESWRRIYEQ